MLAVALRVRAYGRDLTGAKGIMASGACEGRIKGRTHGRTNQQKAEDQNATCQRRAVHTRPKTVFAHTRLSFPEADLVEVSPPEPEATEHGGGERSAFARHLTISGRQLNGRLERVKGIEPSSSAWKAVALPLSYTREPASRCRGAISCEPVAPPTSL